MWDKPLLLLDFNNSAWRAAHSLKNSGLMFDGQPTTVVYGLMGEVSRAMERFGTNRVILCGDHPKGPTKRIALFPEYKHKRRDEDDEEKKQFRETVGQGMRLARRVFRFSGYHGYFHASGYEADDLIAAFCSAYSDQPKVIVSTDQDLYQLLDGETVIHRPGNKDGPMTLQTFHRKYGIVPALWPGVKALAGCKSDNVPGLRGVAEKTAVCYLKGELKYGKKLEAIEKHLRTAACRRDRKLVTIPFDDELENPTLHVPEERFLLSELMWNEICKRAGIESLPYPGGV